MSFAPSFGMYRLNISWQSLVTALYAVSNKSSSGTKPIRSAVKSAIVTV